MKDNRDKTNAHGGFESSAAVNKRPSATGARVQAAPKKGDSRSKQTMKAISPQAPAGKYHG